MSIMQEEVDLERLPVDNSTNTPTGGHDHEHEDEDEDDIVTTAVIDETSDFDDEVAKVENQRVIRLRMLLILTLIVSVIILSFMVHRYIVTKELNQFRDEFKNDAHKVFGSVGGSLQRSLSVMNEFAVAYVSYEATMAERLQNDNATTASATTTLWPFVTLPNFALHASKLLPLTDGLFVSMRPVVDPSLKTQWEEYAVQNDDWVNETLQIQNVWDGYHGEKTYSWKKVDHIVSLNFEQDQNISRFFLPQWQTFPNNIQEPHFPYNFDHNDEDLPQEAIRICVTEQRVVLATPIMISYPDNDIANAKMKAWANYFSAYLPPEDEPFEPMFQIDYPIVNDLSINAVLELDNITATSVGIINIPIYWRSFFRNILPGGSIGIVVVVHNTCNRPFTYQINGNAVVYLGVGDNHDTKYDDLVEIRKLVDLASFSGDGSKYSGAMIDTEYCPYTLYVYPSDSMKALFVSNDATIYTVSIIAIFCFTSFIFVLFDRYVERRQRRVKTAAMHSSAIISSLFPDSVRKRLFHSSSNPPDQQLVSERSNNTASTNLIEGSPIAQEYPDTTVIFADIVGFTAWSASRDPIQVFRLLETLYAGFDGLAKKYGVFKIETIGDCYVAVVGLPESRKNHAVVMAKFADAIRVKMNELTHELEKSLGPGTSNLSLRIGLNSGPTTAGVLRGEKARFQLFGDTVNTASRMEANGEPFRIHVSGSTAELIESAGKGNWLTAREELIEPKGKGTMQTYWCDPVTNSRK